MNTKRLFDCIEAFDTITLYRHVSPDADALGSQFGLKQWIQDTYPEKKVYALGSETSSKSQHFPKNDVVDDALVASSLAIVLDTANTSRIDDARWSIAKQSLRIDHHIIVEHFADDEIIDDLFGATCEIIGYALMQENKQVSSTAAQYLYSGLLADTLRFSLATTTPTTLTIAAFLVKAGVDVPRANEENYSTSLTMFRYENAIRDHFQLQGDHVAYAIVHASDYEAFGLSFNEAKEKVFVLGGIHEFYAWALFIEKGKDSQGNPLYNGSLRSKNIVINDIANQFHGGGHRFACGVSGLTRDAIDALLQQLETRVTKQEL